MYKSVLVVISTIFFTSCGNEARAQQQNYLPENDLHLEDHLAGNSMSEREFTNLLYSIKNVYSSVFSKYGKKLYIKGVWSDSTVNAYAYQQGNANYVEIFGGLARRPEITLDGLALVVCHEIGHHIAGFPMYQNSWASSEGQSDYFASQVCAKKLWEGKGVERDEDVRDYPYDKCDSIFSGSYSDRKLCYRIVGASWSVGKLFSSLSGQAVSFGTPDMSQVSSTYTSHPKAQCRLDTSLAGGLCHIKNDNDEIMYTEQDAMKVACARYYSEFDGSRPRCWYKPAY